MSVLSKDAMVQWGSILHDVCVAREQVPILVVLLDAFKALGFRDIAGDPLGIWVSLC